MTTAQELAADSVLAMKEGIKMFGQYSFFDQGPDSVMDLTALSQQFRDAGADEAAGALRIILMADGLENEADHLVRALVSSLDDWDEIWEQHGDFLGDYY